MHGHVHGVVGQGFEAVPSQVATEKAAALQRAAAVRRRLLREAAELGGELDGDAAELMAAWCGEPRRSVHDGFDAGSSTATGTGVSYFA